MGNDANYYIESTMGVTGAENRLKSVKFVIAKTSISFFKYVTTDVRVHRSVGKRKKTTSTSTRNLTGKNQQKTVFYLRSLSPSRRSLGGSARKMVQSQNRYNSEWEMYFFIFQCLFSAFSVRCTFQCLHEESISGTIENVKSNGCSWLCSFSIVEIRCQLLWILLFFFRPICREFLIFYLLFGSHVVSCNTFSGVECFFVGKQEVNVLLLLLFFFSVI